MGYINPLFRLPAARKLMELPAEQRRLLEGLLRDLRSEADREAENAWRRRKGPMAAYWRAVSTYARHIAHLLAKGDAVPWLEMPHPTVPRSPREHDADEELDADEDRVQRELLEETD